MKLIKEINESVDYLVEKNSESGEKNYYIEGIIMQGDIRNRNGRMYPSKVLARESNRYNENYISKKRAFGELGHPDGPTINLDRVSHRFVDLRQEGNNIVGKAKVMDTPMGKIVKAYIDDGSQLGISSRGMGSVRENKEGVMEVQEDFMLATAGDIVADPSAPDAFVQGVMEGVDWVYDVAEQTWKSQNAFDRIENEIKEDIDELSEAKKIALFTRFIESLT